MKLEEYRAYLNGEKVEWALVCNEIEHKDEADVRMDMAIKAALRRNQFNGFARSWALYCEQYNDFSKLPVEFMAFDEHGRREECYIVRPRYAYLRVMEGQPYQHAIDRLSEFGRILSVTTDQQMVIRRRMALAGYVEELAFESSNHHIDRSYVVRIKFVPNSKSIETMLAQALRQETGFMGFEVER